ncbi:MAG: hypothetical protein PHR06_06950 [Candidatus Cloacimonetes bacterium]|nr:hypothetical protein [Candidatus Cloacimonadota bacterium]
MKRVIRFFLILLTIFTILFVVYSFLFGKLFPYSPIIIGFSEIEQENTIVYIQKGHKFTEMSKIDSLIPLIETFHELEFLKKPRIFVFRDSESYHQRSVSKARFCAFYNGDVVISPWALQEVKRGEIDLEIYLRHELSHSLLHQHSGIIRASRYPAWLLEGIAVYSANQMGTSWYPSKEQTYRYIAEGNYMPPDYFKTKKEDLIKLSVKDRNPFIYCEFACMVDYLIKEEGRTNFLRYMKELCKDRDQKKIFREIFGDDYETFLNDFKTFVKDCETINNR